MHQKFLSLIRNEQQLSTFYISKFLQKQITEQLNTTYKYLDYKNN